MEGKKSGGTPAAASPADIGVDEEVDLVGSAAAALGLSDVEFEGSADGAGNDEGEGDQDDAGASGEEGDGAGNDEGEGNKSDEGDGSGEDEGEGDGDGSDEEGHDAEDTELREKLTPEMQAAFDKAIGKKVRKKKEVEEQLETVQQENNLLKQQLTEANSNRPAAVPQGIHPLMVTNDSAAIDKREQQLREFIDFAVEHEDEGYPGKEDGSDNPIEAKDLRKAKLRAERELSDVIPQARDKLQKQAQLQPYIKKHYPNLFDSKHPDSQLAQNLLNQQPWIRQYPHGLLIVGYILEGMKATQARDAAQGKPPPQKKKEPPKIPARPKAAAAAPGKVAGTDDGAKKGGPVDVEKFVASGGSNESLADAVSSLID